MIIEVRGPQISRTIASLEAIAATAKANGENILATRILEEVQLLYIETQLTPGIVERQSKVY